MLKEIWKDIPGFSRYQVSNLGRVMSKKYTTKDSFGRISSHKEKILSTKPWIEKSNGRPYYIKLKLVDDEGERRTVSVHILVAKVFIPNPDNKPEVNHIDQNRANNTVSNLEWVTKRENMKKCIVPGKSGETNGNSKLKESDVKNICKLIHKNKTDLEIVKELSLNVGTECIRFIRNKTHWSYLKEVQELPELKKDRKNKILSEEELEKICITIKNNPNLSASRIKDLLDFDVSRRTISDIRSKRIYTNHKCVINL